MEICVIMDTWYDAGIKSFLMVAKCFQDNCEMGPLEPVREYTSFLLVYFSTTVVKYKLNQAKILWLKCW